jgi:hypothetical protein
MSYTRELFMDVLIFETSRSTRLTANPEKCNASHCLRYTSLESRELQMSYQNSSPHYNTRNWLYRQFL